MTDSPPRTGLAAYFTVTAAYWAFMLTDGALRMLVLLHFHTLGFSPVQLAYLFLLYEFMGMVTNLSAGWLAARFGLAATLYAGLTVQIIALVALAGLNADWPVWASVVFVMIVQGLSGVAKDLAKMSSKSAVKILAPADGSDALFRWVTLLTGSKNAVKGLGFLLGTVLLGLVGFQTSVLAMAGVLAAILAAVIIVMPSGLPRGSKNAKFNEVWSTDARINRLSAARLFLFGARDTWFVVGIPIYFYAVLSDGTSEGNRAAFFLIGSFMALWIIGYGAVQAMTPRLLGAKQQDDAMTVRHAQNWVLRLAVLPATLGMLVLALPQSTLLTVLLVVGLMAFGVIFALNSALHSYLILAFTSDKRVTMDVGFYYMANAAGRLGGTLLSGVSYQLGGLPLCLATASAMLAASWLFARKLT